jgi:hypothetical protein
VGDADHAGDGENAGQARLPARHHRESITEDDQVGIADVQVATQDLKATRFLASEESHNRPTLDALPRWQ